jgi:hypothetical protein
MTTPPKNLPKFLPTLTEVVDPASVNLAPQAALPEVDALVSAVMARLGALVDGRLQEEMQAFLHGVVAEQLTALSERLRVELEAELSVLVRQSVADALAHPSGH